MLLLSCYKKREVEPTFYYWKTVYKQHQNENIYLRALGSKKLYVRVMDVDVNELQQTIPIAPIEFKDSISAGIKIVPVVFIVNDAIKNQTHQQLEKLAHNILAFVKVKVLESGKYDYDELQIDCDWTQTTRENYFFLLQKIKDFNKGRSISVTLRLHQLKNQQKSGIPPAHKVLLMCYNMGNLRQFGTQNSILDISELRKYVNENLSKYPMEVDIALPLFSWAVVFEGAKYVGIAKRLTFGDLKNKSFFSQMDNGLYEAVVNLPDFGIKQHHIVRYEESKLPELRALAKCLSSYLSAKPINLVYYHLDQQILKNYKSNELEEVAHLLR